MSTRVVGGGICLACLGAFIYWGAIIQLSGPPHLLGIPFVWAVGHLLGAIVAEPSRPRPRRLQAAALAPCRLGDYYLPGWLPTTERLAALAVLTAWSNAAQPRWSVRRSTAPRPRSESGRKPA